MKKFIELGEEKAGSQAKLAEIIDTRYTTLVAVKAGKKSLTTALCIKLARYIEVDELEVIAASNLVIEKNEERRKIFESCFKTARTAALVIMGSTTLLASNNAVIELVSCILC